MGYETWNSYENVTDNFAKPYNRHFNHIMSYQIIDPTFDRHRPDWNLTRFRHRVRHLRTTHPLQ